MGVVKEVVHKVMSIIGYVYMGIGLFVIGIMWLSLVGHLGLLWCIGIFGESNDIDDSYGGGAWDGVSYPIEWGASGGGIGINSVGPVNLKLQERTSFHHDQ